MPEYLAPGVYVEERSFRSKSIEGVSTSTTGFVGGTRYGPTSGEPELMTSFGQFERIYGGLDPLTYKGTTIQSYLAYAVRAFFDNGGARLYIARAFTPSGDSDDAEDAHKGRAAIPAPQAEIAEADALATSVSSRTLAALNEAVSAAQEALAAAITVLRFLTPQVLAVLTVTPEPEIDYDYGEGTNVSAQLGDLVGALVDPELAVVNATLAENGRKDLITAADLAYSNARDTLVNADTARIAVSEAYSNGVDDGEAEATLPDNPIADPSALMPLLQTAADEVEDDRDDLAPLSDDLESALEDIVDETEAVITAAEALNTAVGEVVDAANDSVGDIHDVTEAAVLGYRATVAQAEAQFVARFPGEAGNMTVTVTGRLAANVLTTRDSGAAVPSMREGDLVVIQRGGNAFLYNATRSGDSWSFDLASGGSLALDTLVPDTDNVFPLSLTAEVEPPGAFAQSMLWDGLTTSTHDVRRRDSITEVFAEDIGNRMRALETPVVLMAKGVNTALLAGQLIGLADGDWESKLNSDDSDRLINTGTFELQGGNDGNRPEASAYKGSEDATTGIKRGLVSLEDLEEISIVAAPGYSHDYPTRENAVQQINQHVIGHCERMRYRVGILDSPNDVALSGVRDYRAVLDSKHAAVYYPWVSILDPISNQIINVPPSGFMAGIYARTDNRVGVHKAPANEVVTGGIGLELSINKAQQDVLNPLGINCLRFFEGRGYRVWGARTISSDPEWKYLNIRRYFAYLERSIDVSTQWAVFEPNGEALWDNIRRTAESFLETEWREGRLAGTSTEEAFFVRCDRSTMTQNDLDNGRMICLIGVAPLYPAEFVIFRIGQWTADST